MLTNYIIFSIFFCSHRKGRISIAVYGKYHAVRHIDCAFGANIDLHKYPLIHRRRDDGPPSPQRLLRNRGKVGVGGESCRDDDRQARNSPTDGGECVGLPHTPEGGEGLQRREQGGECRWARTFPTDGGEWCRDGQQGGESRWARTKTYVTEAEPTRSPYMRPYTFSGT